MPSLLLATALVAWLAFQSWQLVAERQQLGQLRLGQDPTVDSASKLRASLDAVASGTAKLADAGNSNARTIVEELRKRGITINSDGTGKPR